MFWNYNHPLATMKKIKGISSELVGPTELAPLLDVKPITSSVYCRQGWIPAIQVGGSKVWITTAAEVKKFAKRRARGIAQAGDYLNSTDQEVQGVNSPLLSAPQVAEAFGYTRNWAIKAMREGRIPATKVSSVLVTTQAEVDAMLEKERKKLAARMESLNPRKE